MSTLSYVHQLFSLKPESLNLSLFVARKNWLKSGTLLPVSALIS